MSVQEIIVFLIVIIAAVFSFRSFARQFLSKDASCTSCSCESLAKKAIDRNRNAIRFKKIKF